MISILTPEDTRSQGSHHLTPQGFPHTHSMAYFTALISELWTTSWESQVSSHAITPGLWKKQGFPANQTAPKP